MSGRTPSASSAGTDPPSDQAGLARPWHRVVQPVVRPPVDALPNRCQHQRTGGGTSSRNAVRSSSVASCRSRPRKTNAVPFFGRESTPRSPSACHSAGVTCSATSGRISASSSARCSSSSADASQKTPASSRPATASPVTRHPGSRSSIRSMSTASCLCCDSMRCTSSVCSATLGSSTGHSRSSSPAWWWCRPVTMPARYRPTSSARSRSPDRTEPTSPGASRNSRRNDRWTTTISHVSTAIFPPGFWSGLGVCLPHARLATAIRPPVPPRCS